MKIVKFLVSAIHKSDEDSNDEDDEIFEPDRNFIDVFDEE